MVAEQSYRSTHSDVASAVTADFDMYADLVVENLPRRLDQLARSGKTEEIVEVLRLIFQERHRGGDHGRSCTTPSEGDDKESFSKNINTHNMNNTVSSSSSVADVTAFSSAEK